MLLEESMHWIYNISRRPVVIEHVMSLFSVSFLHNISQVQPFNDNLKVTSQFILFAT
jgi:hypothetical protein